MYNFVIPHPRSGSNSYLRLLEEGIRARGHQCTFADSAVAPNPGDILWIHWPEDLTNYSSPNVEQTAAIADWLDRWRRDNIVLWTVHNLHRHGMPLDQGFNALYLLVAESAHGQIHHGHPSISLTQQRFPEAMPQATKVVNHGGYFNLLGEATRESARIKLSLPDEGRILLLFGAIRASEEYQMAVEAAALGWHVLIAGRTPNIGRKLRLKNWLRSQFNKITMTVHAGQIADEDVDTYVKACDAMLIARTSSLNSGNVFLGMTFGRAIIGPDCGNMGEVIQATGNYLFDPMNPQSLKETLTKALHADLESVGMRNAKWITSHGSWEAIAAAAESAVEEIKAADHVPSI